MAVSLQCMTKSTTKNKKKKGKYQSGVPVGLFLPKYKLWEACNYNVSESTLQFTNEGERLYETVLFMSFLLFLDKYF